MEIQITHTENSFTSMDAVVIHKNEKVIVPMNFRMRGSAMFNDPGQLVTELNQNWSRRTEDSKNKMFRMYRCIARCLENHNDYKTGRLEEYRVLVEATAPYMVRLLNDHNIDMLVGHMENWYTDIIPADMPDHSDDPSLYTYDEYKELQALVLAVRSIWPAIEMLLQTGMDYPKEEKDMVIYCQIMKPGTDLYHSAALRRLYDFVEAYVKKNGRGDPNALMSKLLFMRLTKHPILTSDPVTKNLISEIYRFLARETHPANPEGLRDMDKVLSERNK